jgi:aspartate/methionine/tyrosine aminotransferase
VDDLRLAERLVREHRVAVIPGGTFGITNGAASGSLTES